MFLMVASKQITRGVIFKEISGKVFNMGLRVWRIRIYLRMCDYLSKRIRYEHCIHNTKVRSLIS